MSNYTILTILGVLWFLTGSFSFIYHWTKDSDYTSDEFLLTIAYGFTGFIGALLLWLDTVEPFKIFKKRN